MVKMPWRKAAPSDETKLPEEVPKEVEEYYDANRRSFSVTAILLGLATLAITIILALGIFYGGRWLYNYAFNDNDNKGETTQDTPTTANPQQTDNPQDNSASPSDDQNATSDDDQPRARRTPSSGPETPETTPRTGPEIPHTGPTSDE